MKIENGKIILENTDKELFEEKGYSVRFRSRKFMNSIFVEKNGTTAGFFGWTDNVNFFVSSDIPFKGFSKNNKINISSQEELDSAFSYMDKLLKS